MRLAIEFLREWQRRPLRPVEAATLARDAMALRSAYRQVFSSPQGQLVLEDLARFGHFASSTAFRPERGGALEANEMIFREGERNVVLRILAMSGVEPAAKPKEENDE